MSTFLALCQRVASDSGTISGAFPTTVTGQTGRLGKIVRWTADAWRSIQNASGSWRWMRSEFSGSTVVGQVRYTAAQMSIASRFGEWICNGPDEQRFSIYLTASGVSDQGALKFLEWDTFYVKCLRGTQTNGKPTYFSIAPDNQLCLSPPPDAVYTVQGPYRKSAQELTADADEPEMPSRFHDLIADVALISLDTHDEAPQQLSLHQMRRAPKFSELERDQLPRLTLAGALA